MCRLSLQCGFAAILALGYCLTANGQPPEQPRVLTAPVPLESGIGGPAVPSGVNAPVSIGPAPTPGSAFYPPPRFPYDRGAIVSPRPTAAGPAYVVPFAGGPALLVPSQPVPFATNFGPRDFLPGTVPAQVPNAAPVVRRPVGPSNLRVSLSESFLNRLIAQDRVQPGPVRDVILGAQVSGQQTTVSRVRADMLAATDKGRVALVLNGDVQSLTTGATPQAMIDTLGRQQFFAVKEVYFDGVQLSTRHAEIYIRALNQTLGAMTPLSGTLFGNLADRIAFQAAERRKPESEAVARDRLADRLFPSFDGEVDARLAQANRQLGPIRKWLDSVKLLPSSQAVCSTDTQLFYDAYVGEVTTQTLAPASEAPEGQGVNLSIHESLLNTFIDRTGLKGLKTTDQDLRKLEERYLTGFQGGSSSEESEGSALKAPVLPGDSAGFVTDIEFDELEPLKVHVERDRVIVTIKAHFKPAGQALVPPMTVTIPYRTAIVGDKLRLTADTPTVFAQDRQDSSAPPTITEKVIQKVVEAELEPLEFDRRLPATLWRFGGAAPAMTSITSDDNGWINIAIE